MTARFADGEPARLYHQAPALSAGGAHRIAERCAAAYYHSSPFNPAWSYEADAEFIIGTAAHLAILEPDEFETRAAVLPFDEYRSNAAKAARDEALAADRVPLKPKQRDQVMRIRDAIFVNPEARRLLEGGASERSIYWVDPASGVPCKARPDKMPLDGAFLVDLKTTGSAQDMAIRRVGASMGWHMRAEWYLEGAAAVGFAPQEYHFVIVEAEAPHLVRICTAERGQEELVYGAEENATARAIVADCLRTGAWPGYPPRMRFALPYFMQMQLEERRLERADRRRTEKPTRELLAMAANMYQPTEALEDR